MKSGIYIIRNSANGRAYVGSAVHITQRWHEHRYLLRAGKHHSIKLQRAWAKYGEESFEFAILEPAPIADLIAVEQRWIDKLSAADPAKGYNVATRAGSRWGVKHSAETRARFSAARLGQKRSLQTRQRISEALTGRTVSAETRARQSAARIGRPLGPQSPEHRAKLSAALKGRLCR